MLILAICSHFLHPHAHTHTKIHTIMLWLCAYDCHLLTGECATRCGYPGALAVAQAAYPLVYLLAVAIGSHKREWRNYVPPPSAEQVAMMQMQEVGSILVRL